MKSEYLAEVKVITIPNYAIGLLLILKYMNPAVFIPKSRVVEMRNG